MIAPESLRHSLFGNAWRTDQCSLCYTWETYWLYLIVNPQFLEFVSHCSSTVLCGMSPVNALVTYFRLSGVHAILHTLWLIYVLSHHLDKWTSSTCLTNILVRFCWNSIQEAFLISS